LLPEPVSGLPQIRKVKQEGDMSHDKKPGKAKPKKTYSWRLVEMRFRELKSRRDAEKLQAEFYINGFPKEPAWKGSLWALREVYDLHSEFQTIAKLAVITAGRGGNTWQDWLNLLRLEKYGYKRSAASVIYSRIDDAGEIRELCAVSERFCRDRADAAGKPLLLESGKSDGRQNELSTFPSCKGLVYDEAGPRLWIDEIPENLSDQQNRMWSALWKAEGRKVPGKQAMDTAEAAKRIKYSMPPRVKNEIRSDHNGYWLIRFVPT
jgi:hypothetical protein